MELSQTEGLLIAIFMALVGIFIVLLSIAGFWGWLGKLIFPPATQWDDRGFGEHLADWLKSQFSFSDAVDSVFAIVALLVGWWSGYLLAVKVFGLSGEIGASYILGFAGSVAGLFLAMILREKLDRD